MSACSLESRGGCVAPKNLISALSTLAKYEQKKALKLFSINDVDDEIDGGIKRDEKVGHLSQRSYGYRHELKISDDSPAAFLALFILA